METLLDRLGVCRSRIFCLPFGKSEDASSETVNICAETEFTGLLYCRGARHYASWREEPGPVKIGERLLMPSSYLALILRSGTIGSLLRRVEQMVQRKS